MKTIRDEVESFRSFPITPALDRQGSPLSCLLADAPVPAGQRWASPSPTPIMEAASDDVDEDDEVDDEDDWDDDDEDYDDEDDEEDYDDEDDTEDDEDWDDDEDFDDDFDDDDEDFDDED